MVIDDQLQLKIVLPILLVVIIISIPSPYFTYVIIGFGFMVFNTTVNNISVLLVEETGVPGENLSHNLVSSTPRHEGVRTQTLVVICTDCTALVNPTIMRSRPQRPPYEIVACHKT